MGGSKSYSIKVLHGTGSSTGSGSSGEATDSFVNAVETGVTDAIVAQGLNAIIACNPTINTLLSAMEIIKVVYEMCEAAYKEYEHSHDTNAAILAAGEVVLDKVIEKGKEELLSIAVAQCWSNIKETNHLPSSDVIDTIITDSATNVLEEYVK